MVVLSQTTRMNFSKFRLRKANRKNAPVNGTMSNEEKAVQAKEDGCHHVIIYSKEDLVTAVNNITSGGINDVYDSVGKDTIQVEAGFTPSKKMLKKGRRRCSR